MTLGPIKVGPCFVTGGCRTARKPSTYKYSPEVNMPLSIDLLLLRLARGKKDFPAVNIS